jgi:hypothetical protein
MTSPNAAGSGAGKAFASGVTKPEPVNLYADAMDFAMQFATIPKPPGQSVEIGELISNAETIYDFISKK